MVFSGHVPASFGMSYTVLVPKNNASVYSKSLTIDDFTGISISLVLSKIFEHCILDRYCKYFVTSDNQFGTLNVNRAVHMQFTRYDLWLITMLIMAVLSTCVYWIYQRRSTR